MAELVRRIELTVEVSVRLFSTTTPMVPPVLAVGSIWAKSNSVAPGSYEQYEVGGGPAEVVSVPSTILLTTSAEFMLVLHDTPKSAGKRMNQRLFMFVPPTAFPRRPRTARLRRRTASG